MLNLSGSEFRQTHTVLTDCGLRYVLEVQHLSRHPALPSADLPVFSVKKSVLVFVDRGVSDFDIGGAYPCSLISFPTAHRHRPSCCVNPLARLERSRHAAWPI